MWANADTPEDAERALQFGAEGIGLCRTEHMFFSDNRLPIVRQMILAAPGAAELDDWFRDIQEKSETQSLSESEIEKQREKQKVPLSTLSKLRTASTGAPTRKTTATLIAIDKIISIG